MRLPRLAPLALALAAALAAGACANDPDPQYVVGGTGSLSGRLFFDADNNGLFTPVGGDTLLKNVLVEVRQRGTATVIDSTRTDAQGMFAFAALPAGTHDVTIVGEPGVTGGLLFCQSPVATSVYINEQAFVSTIGKNGCVVRINVAKTNPLPASVTVSGVVTAAQGTFRSDNAYIQDPSGGLLLFGLPSTLNLQVGDSIEVSGTLTTFSNEYELTSPRVAANIKRGGAVVPTPKEYTTGDLAKLNTNSADAGRLVVIRKAAFSSFIGGGTPARNANVDDGSGPVQIRLDGNTLTAIGTATFVTGHCYDITGVVGIFTAPAVQLKPRTPADVVEVSCT